MSFRVWGVLLFLVLGGSAVAQEPVQQAAEARDMFSRKNTFTVFAEYSNTSSHILLGDARQRILADLGGSYTRRLLRFRGSEFGYLAEVRPVLFESDPFGISTDVQTFTSGPSAGTTTTSVSAGATYGRCVSSTVSGSLPAQPPYFPSENYMVTNTCGRQWTFAQEFSPAGMKYSMRTNHRIQPFFAGTVGYMYSSRPIPLADASPFNFVFDFGPGIEIYRGAKGRSMSIEARYHHFSNKNTAAENPGTDNVVYKVSYSFGR